jgi:hypothetical protein
LTGRLQKGCNTGQYIKIISSSWFDFAKAMPAGNMRRIRDINDIAAQIFNANSSILWFFPSILPAQAFALPFFEIYVIDKSFGNDEFLVQLTAGRSYPCSGVHGITADGEVLFDHPDLSYRHFASMDAYAEFRQYAISPAEMFTSFSAGYAALR